MKASWLNRDQLFQAEQALAARLADLLHELDTRWEATPVDMGEPGTVRLLTCFASESGPELRIDLNTRPEHTAQWLHEHFMQPVREAARQRRLTPSV